MSRSIEYNGHLIEPTTRRTNDPRGWTLQVRITSVGRDTDVRRCRSPKVYPTRELAVTRCLEFGRRIVDGRLQPKGTPRR